MIKSINFLISSLAALSMIFAAASLHADSIGSKSRKRLADASGDAGTIKVTSKPNNPDNQPEVNVKKKNDDSYMMIKKEPMKDPNAQNSLDTGKLTIVDILANDPSFSNLSKALAATDLKSTLAGRGPFTIFVPDDSAFAKVSPNIQQDWFKPENKSRLAELLAYHIVPGKIGSSDIKTMKLKTLNGQPLDIKVESNEIKVNNARITRTDIVGSNGVIHVIDAVLIPSDQQ